MSTQKRDRTPAGGVVIGLLGAIGSGKSTIAAAFRQLGAEVVDADALAHKFLQEPDIKRAVAAEFGESILTETGAIDRARLGAVFSDPDQLARLEAILHPPILAEIREAVEECHRARPGSPRRVLVLDVPLLVETGIHDLADFLVFAETPRSLRLERLAKRSGFDEAELTRREKLQSSINFKRNLADYMVDCSKSRESIGLQIRTIWREIGGV